MVFFTCNHCGESVKKPSVEKHYQFKCKKVVSVSCMDCLKDFHGDEYVQHTKCISEAEKYSGKDYVAKQSKNTGQKKQENWLEIVRSILSNKQSEVSPDVRGIFHKLQSYENVPRKKVKFENFVRNSMRISKQQAETVWLVFEKALDKFKAARESNNQNGEATNESSGDSAHLQDTDMNGHVDSKAEVVVEKKKKNKKEEINGNIEEEPSKKKKKSKNQDVNEDIAEKSEETPTMNNNHSVDQSKKSSKKKKAKSNEGIANEEDQEMQTIAEENPCMNGGVQESPKKKKKSGFEDTNANIEESKVKKSKQKRAFNEEKVEKKNENVKAVQEDNLKINGEMEDQPKTKKKKSNNANEENLSTDNANKNDTPFDWTTVIFNILNKHNNQISFDKLRTKVLKKYKIHHNTDEISHKVERTFDKKLRKSGLVVENEIVKTK